MKTAPLAVIAFNRPDALRHCLEALSVASIASETDLFIFIDGARSDHPGEDAKVAEVVDVARAASGFRSVGITASTENKGLAASVVGAATSLLDRYGRVIVVEDDLLVAPGFLLYMNGMLDRFEDDDRIMQVSAFGTMLGRRWRNGRDVYMNGRAQCWSWATWSDRWDTVDWNVPDFDELASSRRLRRNFNRFGSDLFSMLKGWKTGANNSWFIRFDYAMHKQGRFCICPVRSLVHNDGFNADATNCRGFNRYRTDDSGWGDSEWRVPEHPEWVKGLNRSAVRYWSIAYRIYGKIRLVLDRSFK